jgi:hypothetical protein
VIVPLIGAGVKSKSAVVSAQRRLNVYLEPQRDQDKTPIAVYGTPGLTKVMDEGALPFRGGVAVGDTLYVARGNIFESVNNAFVSTDLNAAARLTTNNGRVSMATNELVIVLVDGTNGYIYDITAGTFAQIASAMFANPQTVTYQDGYFLATFLETGTNKKRCQISADGVTWNALDYRAIDTTPGALLRSLSFGGEVHQFSDKGSNSGRTPATRPSPGRRSAGRRSRSASRRAGRWRWARTRFSSSAAIVAAAGCRSTSSPATACARSRRRTSRTRSTSTARSAMRRAASTARTSTTSSCSRSRRPERPGCTTASPPR